MRPMYNFGENLMTVDERILLQEFRGVPGPVRWMTYGQVSKICSGRVRLRVGGFCAKECQAILWPSACSPQALARQAVR